MSTTLATYTFQSVTLDSPDGKKLLRSIARNPDQWRGRCSAETGWILEFVRTIPGDVGNPDSAVTVRTDCNLEPHGRRETRETIDGKEYTVRCPECRRIRFDRHEIPMLVKLLLDKWTIRTEYRFGSLNTAALGLSYHNVIACPDSANRYQYVTLSTTTYQNFRRLTCGAMED